MGGGKEREARKTNKEDGRKRRGRKLHEMEKTGLMKEKG